MEEMWKMLIRHDLTPNQFYLLYSIRESVTTPTLNAALELRSLKGKGWILENGELSGKAQRIVKEVEGFFKRAQKKSNEIIMGNDFEKKIALYNNLWPKMRLPSGKAARSGLKNLEPGFRWFFENYEFTWEQVLEATNYYLDDRERENWNYTKTSQYFVRKQQTDKSWQSELADVCQLIADGAHEGKGGHFKENVF